MTDDWTERDRWSPNDRTGRKSLLGLLFNKKSLPPRGFRMCGKQRACRRVILEVWQAKELETRFADLWQGKNLRESSVDSKGFTARVSSEFLEVWIAKELVQAKIEYKGVAGALGFDNLEDLSDFLEVWQAKGLTDKENKLGEGALAGRTGRGTVPTNMSSL